jgi:maleamate amidohydrolase
LQGSALIDIVPELASEPGELVLDKRNPSIFFCTALLPWLVANRIDSLLVAGCTTSRCVRACVVDGMSVNYPCFVIERCVGDRSIPVDDASLFDLRPKYADVPTISWVIQTMARVRDTMRPAASRAMPTRY